MSSIGRQFVDTTVSAKLGLVSSDHATRCRPTNWGTHRLCKLAFTRGGGSDGPRQYFSLVMVNMSYILTPYIAIIWLTQSVFINAASTKGYH